MVVGRQIEDTETFTGQVEEKRIIKRFIKRFIKKTLDWYLYPWAMKQNQFNKTVMDIQNKLLKSESMCSRDIEQLKMICATSDVQDKYVISPEIDEINAILKEKQNDDITDIEHMFKNQIENIQTDKEYIVLICSDFSAGRKIEAIRKEAFFIFNKLKKNSIFLPILVSLKQESDEFFQDGDIFYVGDRCLPKFLESINVRALVWNCPVVNYAHCASDVTLKYVTLMRLTSQNPLQMDEEDIEGYALETLLHLNDYGFLHMMTMSEYAKNKLEDAGFKNVKMLLPQLDLANFQRKDKSGMQRVIGFASSPMMERQIERRGIGLLAQVAVEKKEYKFKILWRDNSIKVPQKLLNCKNVEIVYGYVDMDTFYNEIDSLIIPYCSSNDNHGCSLSAVEAMLLGIPVIATEKSGVSELVRKLGAGMVCASEVEDICEAIEKVYEDYELFRTVGAYNFLCQLLSEHNIVHDIHTLALEYRPDNIVTLDEWDRALQKAGSRLVIGRENIKKYYSQFSVAEHYTEQRFSSIHDKGLDLFERLSIDHLIKSIKKKEVLHILDIASGDGRILQEDLKFGECIAMDASEPMLNLVSERFVKYDNLKTIKGDYFTDLISGEFDVITTFRYIRHFSYSERKTLYNKIRANLKEDGLLIFDVPNIKFEMEQRKKNGWQNYNIYDVFWTKEGIIDELNNNGFRIHVLIEIGKGLTQDSAEPMTWTIAAIRKD